MLQNLYIVQEVSYENRYCDMYVKIFAVDKRLDYTACINMQHINCAIMSQKDFHKSL